MKRVTRAQLVMERRTSRKQKKKIEALEAENQKQGKIIRELEGLNALWTSDAAVDMQGRKTRRPVAHNVELLEAIQSDEYVLHAVTRMTPEKFKVLLEAFTKWMMEDPKNDVPLFYKSIRGAGESGNRCVLNHNHVLLMILIYYKDNPTQDALEATFGIDQTTVSRYLALAKRAMSDILPTATNIYEKMCNASTAKELEEILNLGAPKPLTESEIDAKFKKAMGLSPIFAMTDHMKSLHEAYHKITHNISQVFSLDGTHVRTHRPEDYLERKARYSGKKKHCSFNTNVMINGSGLIVFAGKSVNGSMHDLTLFKEDRPDLGILKKQVRDGAVWSAIIQYLFADKGYVGIKDLIQGIKAMVPIKKQRKTDKFGGLTQEERDYSRMVSSIRISVEHAIGRIKQHDRMVDTYTGTLGEFSQDFDICTGLANFHHSWRDIRDGRYKLG